jgi:hypothetical protein
MNCLRPLEHWDRGFESHSRHGCLSAFILFALSCVGNGLATGWSPVQGVLPTVLGLGNWIEPKRFTDAPCSKLGATGKRECYDVMVIISAFISKPLKNIGLFHQYLFINTSVIFTFATPNTLHCKHPNFNPLHSDVQATYKTDNGTIKNNLSKL